MRVNRFWSARFVLTLSIGLLSNLMIPRLSLSDEPTERIAQVVDSAHMIDPALASILEADLTSQAVNAKIPILIETVDSLNGRTIREAINKKEFAPGRDGLYVLLAKKEHRIEVRVSKRFEGLIDEADQKAIRDAFIEGLRKEKPEVGMAQGVQAITRTLRKVPILQLKNEESKGPESSTKPAASGTQKESGRASPLVVRNQVKLALSGARRIIEGAEAKANEMGQKSNIAVVDDGGHLLSFARMDGARPASAYTAITKATTAATFRQETGPLPRGTTSPDPLLNISLQNAAAASGGKITTLFGGVPVIVDGQVIGGVGVGGGTGEQDAMVAKAGIEAFLKEVEASQKPPASTVESKSTLP